MRDDCAVLARLRARTLVKSMKAETKPAPAQMSLLLASLGARLRHSNEELAADRLPADLAAILAELHMEEWRRRRVTAEKGIPWASGRKRRPRLARARGLSPSQRMRFQESGQ